MSLFGDMKELDPRFDKLRKLYATVMDRSIDWDTRISSADEFLSLRQSLSEKDEKNFKKEAINEGKKDKTIKSVNHPVFGFFFEDDSLLKDLTEKVKWKKGRVIKRKAHEEEYNNIALVTPAINTDNVLEKHSMSEVPEIKIQKVTESFDMDKKMHTFVVFNLETTGFRPGLDKITKVAAVRYENGVPTKAFITPINPRVRSSAEDSNAEADKKEAPQLSDISESLMDFIGDSPILGYNAPMDLRFMYCNGIDLISGRKIYDAKNLAKKLYKEIDYYSINNVLDYQEINVGEVKGAKKECYAIGKVFMEMVHKITE